MRGDCKKRREEAYLRRFRENFVGFPKGAIVPHEHPDFLVDASGGRVGIELTEYHVPEPDEGRGSPMRAQEGTEDKVLQRACEQYQSKDLPPVMIKVLWHPHQALGRRRITELAGALANLVQENLPETGHSVTIRRHRHLTGRFLPQEVASLTVVRRNSISKDSWTSRRAGFVPTITPPDLQRILRDKEHKVHTYRQNCKYVWLIIVTRGFEPSTFGDLDLEVDGYRFESSFDRVFFLHHFDGSVSELHVSQDRIDI